MVAAVFLAPAQHERLVQASWRAPLQGRGNFCWELAKGEIEIIFATVSHLCLIGTEIIYSAKKGTHVSKSHALANMNLFLLVSHRKRWRIYCGFVCTVASACSNAPFFAQVTAAFGDCQPRPPIPQLWKKLFPNLLREFAFWHPKLLSANNALLFWTSQNGKKVRRSSVLQKRCGKLNFFISIPTLHPFFN